MPLYLDYRPTTLKQIFGNEEIKETLKYMVERGDERPHSYLFTGRPGCGKTTFGFVLKNLLNVSTEDFHVYDTANTRGIGTIRDIIEDMKYSPFSGHHKLYLLDEFHMCTPEAMNALLRTLEYGCPKHCYFVLCTAEFESIKGTLRNALSRRCARFEVKPLNPREMKEFLNYILDKEGFEEYPISVINKLVSVSDGSPGEALNALDSVIDLSDEDKILESIEHYIYGGKNIIDICKIIIDDNENKWERISKIIPDIKSEDAERARRAMLTFFERRMLNEKTLSDPHLASIMELLTESFVHIGRAGITLTCYLICRRIDDIPF